MYSVLFFGFLGTGISTGTLSVSTSFHFPPFTGRAGATISLGSNASYVYANDRGPRLAQAGISNLYQTVTDPDGHVQEIQKSNGNMPAGWLDSGFSGLDLFVTAYSPWVQNMANFVVYG